MDIENKFDEYTKHIKRFSILLAFFIFSSNSFGSDWKFTPDIIFSETYSDNINLNISGQEKDAFVTELSPSLSIRNRAARNNLNLDYRMQNLHNSGGSNDLNIFHQLEFNSNSEIFRDSLFLDLSSSVSQQNVSNVASRNDNLAGSRNRADVITYGISPYWTPHLNGYVEGEVRFDHNKVITDNSLASDTEFFNYVVNLNSDKRFTWVSWFLNFNRREQKRDTGNDITFQDALLEIRGRINRHFNVFTQLGHADNSFQSNSNNNENGFFYSFGAQWKPSERFIVEAVYGNNSFVTVEIMPTRNINWVTTYRNNDKGTNTGDVWESSLNYRTKRSTWTASYLEDTTTVQQQLLETPGIVLQDVNETPVQIFDQVGDLVPFRNEVILIRRGTISVSYRTGKSDLNANLFSSRTTFQVSQEKNNVLGANGSWNWRFERRTSLFVRPAWQQTTRDNSKDNRYDITLGLNRRIPVKIGRVGMLNAGIEYRYLRQNSNLLNNSFTENRVSASLALNF